MQSRRIGGYKWFGGTAGGSVGLISGMLVSVGADGRGMGVTDYGDRPGGAVEGPMGVEALVMGVDMLAAWEVDGFPLAWVSTSRETLRWA